MQRQWVSWLTTLMFGLAGCSGATNTSAPPLAAGPAVLAELESLPVGLEVIHSPSRVGSPVGPESEGWPYRWKFRTEVRAIEKPLTIVQFGSCAWDGMKWVIPRDTRRYDAGLLDQSAFEEWFGLAGARIEPGKPAVDPENWAGSYTRTSFRQRWFFIGTDDQGKRYKGEAIVELRADD